MHNSLGYTPLPELEQNPGVLVLKPSHPASVTRTPGLHFPPELGTKLRGPDSQHLHWPQSNPMDPKLGDKTQESELAVQTLL